jgi:creatinine amidohydrolase
VGKSNEHLHAPGTLTLTAATALAAWTEIGLSVARAGVRKIVIVNSHGGNLDLVSILSRELRVRAGMLAVKCQWGSFGHPEGMYPAHELAYGIHGGDVETSLMLAFRPDCVDMAAASNNRSTAERTAISPIGPISYGWISRDLNDSGTVGDASAATAEKGAATAEHQARGFIGLLRKVREASLDGLEPTDPAL